MCSIVNADLFCLYLPINFINTTIMRKVQLLFVCLMLSAAAFAADKVVKLPKPNLNRTGTVMKALSERQSTRELLLICQTYYGRPTESIVRMLENERLLPL